MLLWAIVIGAAGFICGFVGPIIFAPDANQGPLLGIFITGPAGAAAGAVLGLIVRALNVSRQAATRSLTVAAAAMAAVTIYFCIPAPSFRADMIDAEIRRCVPVASLREAAVEQLNKTAAGRPPSDKPVQWGDAFDSANVKEAGVVIEVHVFRRSKLYENRARWNLGTLVTDPWTAGDGETRYFANYLGKDCANYANAARTVYAATGHVGIWPPAYIAEMLGLKVVAPLPAKDLAGLQKVLERAR